jgi:hypothetical protein
MMHSVFPSWLLITRAFWAERPGYRCFIAYSRDFSLLAKALPAGVGFAIIRLDKYFTIDEVVVAAKAICHC